LENSNRAQHPETILTPREEAETIGKE